MLYLEYWCVLLSLKSTKSLCFLHVFYTTMNVCTWNILRGIHSGPYFCLLCSVLYEGKEQYIKINTLCTCMYTYIKIIVKSH